MRNRLFIGACVEQQQAQYVVGKGRLGRDADGFFGVWQAGRGVNLVLGGRNLQPGKRAVGLLRDLLLKFFDRRRPIPGCQEQFAVRVVHKREMRILADDKLILQPRCIVVLLPAQTGPAPQMLNDVRLLGSRRGGLGVPQVQDGQPISLRQLLAVHSAQAERRERLLRAFKPAGALQKNSLVVQHHLAQLRILENSQVLARFDVLEGACILAKLKLAETEHGARRPLLRIECDHPLERVGRRAVLVVVVIDGAERPPPLGPSRIEGQGAVEESDSLIEAPVIACGVRPGCQILKR